MGFMDKAKQMAEQAQKKLDEVQADFNKQQGQGQQQDGPPPVEYDKHGRPIQPAEPEAPAAPPAAAAPPPAPDAPPAPPAPPPPSPPPAVLPPRPAPCRASSPRRGACGPGAAGGRCALRGRARAARGGR